MKEPCFLCWAKFPIRCGNVNKIATVDKIAIGNRIAKDNKICTVDKIATINKIGYRLQELLWLIKFYSGVA